MYPAVTESDHQIQADVAASESQAGFVPPAMAPPFFSPAAAYVPPYMSMGAPAAMTPRWSTGLCRCCEDPAICLVTSFCPCITFGLIAEIVDKGNPSCGSSGCLYGILLSLTGLACLYSCHYRSKLRSQYDLPEAPCMDCLVHFCCETCALCQEYRELKNRGFDVSLGWEANVGRQRRGGVTVAPTTPTMIR